MTILRPASRPLLPLASMLVALGALAATSSCGKDPAAAAGGGAFQMPPTPVETAAAERRTVRETITAVGTIDAGESVAIAPEIDGMVASLPFKEGDPVEKGQAIALLDDAQLAAEVARAEAVRDQQQQAFDRTRKIVAEKVGPPQALDDAAASLKVAEANLQVARTRLEKTRILAPFDGVVGARTVSPGAFLRAGDAITTISQVEELKVRFTAPERYLPKLAVGTSVQISTKAFPDAPVEGSIDLMEPAVDPATRNVRLRARVKNPTGTIRPGMSADVTIVLEERSDALTIPSEAVFAEGSETLVYVVGGDGSVKRTPVTLGSRLPDVVEVLSGLEAGATVVRSGHQKLFDGAKVAAAGAGAPPATAATEEKGEAAHATE